MAAEYNKPLPHPTPAEAPYWEYARKHELRLQKCLDCGNIWYPPAWGCSKCLSTKYEWAKMSGKGKIWSWVIFHQYYIPGFSEEVPYNVIAVNLEEGPQLISQLVGVKNEDIKCDIPVEVFFDDVTPEFSLVKFKPATETKPSKGK